MVGTKAPLNRGQWAQVALASPRLAAAAQPQNRHAGDFGLRANNTRRDAKHRELAEVVENT